ncbi:hypothetical protein GGI12_001086 [Dipsacomyces acuminosporus]|nr:hypothetical protein GGI12_001086 [Dipsacomyces acuminosporus]
MYLFGSPRREGFGETAPSSSLKLGTLKAPADPFGRKSFRSSLSHSVKTLFSKRAPSSSPGTKKQPADKQPSTIRRMTSAHCFSAETTQQASSNSSEMLDNGRHSKARARALAETARRLQQNAPVSSPSTVSSISTINTLQCFPEEAEYEAYSHPSQPVAEISNGLSLAALTETTAIPTSCGRPSPWSPNARSRATSVAIDTNSRNRNNLGLAASLPNAALRPHSLMNVSRESLSQCVSPTTAYSQSTYSISPRDLPHSAGYDTTPLPRSFSPSSSWTLDNSSRSTRPERKSSQRHSVAMSQSVSRRFQSRLTHEYEQRIYCLHSHYSDLIERMEARAQQDADRVRKLEAELIEQRKVNATLQIKEVELMQNIQGQQHDLGLQLGGASGGLSKKLVEFVDHYQDEVSRLTREASTAQEWVVTLAELVIGPKKEHQSWDEWLNLCLDTLQKRREQQKEEEWLKKIGWRGC